MQRNGLKLLVLAAAALSGAAHAQAVPAGDPAVGQKLFIQCKACHTTEPGGKNLVGPNLSGIMGSKTGEATRVPGSAASRTSATAPTTQPRRRVELTVAMPALLYLVFGATQKTSDAVGSGNVAFYVLIGMAVYGAILAAATNAASVAIEQQAGWTRTLMMTPLQPAGYVATKIGVALAMGALPIAVLCIAGIATGEVTVAGEALAAAGITPVVLREKEGLALINGTDGMLGMLLMGLADLRHLARVADLTAATEALPTTPAEGDLLDDVPVLACLDQDKGLSTVELDGAALDELQQVDAPRDLVVDRQVEPGGQVPQVAPSDLDLIEINEAFAAVGLASTKALGINPDIVNVNGGAIAIGHPIGTSGARITLHLALELQRRGGGVGVAALCGAGGQGDALIIRVPKA